MIKKLMALMLLSILSIACGSSSPTAPNMSGDILALETPTPAVVPAWTREFEGQVVQPQPKDGICKVYLGRGVGDDPEVATHIEQNILPAADRMSTARAKGGIRFVRVFTSNGADLTMAVAPELLQNPTALAQNAISIQKPGYLITHGDISFRSREWALTNVALHEIGHYLFGPGHSGAQGDIMGIRDYAQPDFSVSEFTIWHQIRDLWLARANSMSRSEHTSVTIIVD